MIATACTGTEDPDPAPTKEPSADPTASPDDGVAIRKMGAWGRKACDLPITYLRRIARGHHESRAPELAFVPRKPNFFGDFAVTSHSGPWPYLQEVPLTFYGPGHIRSLGRFTPARPATVADLPATLAELVGMEWPADRPGRPLEEVLIEEDRRGDPPKMILVVVWDGGGWNVLNRWPEAWPHLARLMEEGANVEGTIVGSSPSVTPAIHATIGTGLFPDEHGAVDLSFRNDDGEVQGIFEGDDPRDLLAPTFVDLYDPTTDNAAEIGMLAERNWHMGMVGHGSSIDGGDKDIVVFGSGAGEEVYTNPKFFTLPGYVQGLPGLEEDLREVDMEDGALDDTWVGHNILGDETKLRQTPVQTLYQTRQIEAILAREGFGGDDVTDIFFTNYKEIDLVGHIYNMVQEETRSTLAYTDRSLRDLTRFLDRQIGRGEWVVAVTADHGQGPDPVEFGAWPINRQELVEDIAAHFDLKVRDVVDETRITGLWLNLDKLETEGISVGDVADLLVRYRMRDNVSEDVVVPPGYADRMNEKLFDAAFPSELLPEITACARRR